MTEPESWIDEEGNRHFGVKPKNAKKSVAIGDLKGPIIKFKIDSTKEFKELQNENTDLKAKLITVAEKEFDRQVDESIQKAEKLGIDVNFISNPEELRYVQKQIKDKKDKKTSTRDIPLSGNMLGFNNPDNEGKSIRDMQFTSQNEMFETLNTLRKKGSLEQRKEANKILVHLTKKSAQDLASGSVYEFTGSLKDAKKNVEEKNKWKKLR